MGIKDAVDDGLAKLSTPARTHRFRIGVGGAVGLVLVALVIAVLVSAFSSHGGSEVIAPNPTADSLAIVTDAPEVYVHVLGAVSAPGLYQLRPGDRTFDAVASAGGFTADADKAAINLARQLSDGEQLYVPRIGESPPATGSGVGVGGTASALVNLNTATVEQLDSLPRVGPATAQKIIDWRTAHGRFTSIDDLLSVSGIGQKTVDGFRDLVTV